MLYKSIFLKFYVPYNKSEKLDLGVSGSRGKGARGNGIRGMD